MGAMRNENEPDGSAGPDTRRPSKSARKREAGTLQELGVRLAALPDQEIDGLDLPENLVAALRALRRLTSHGAQLRQRQYIGKLMRATDPAPIIARLDLSKRRHDQQVREFRQIERWRDRLLSAEPGAADELLRLRPGADRQALAGLVEKARRDRDIQDSPAGSRALFAYLKQLLG